MSEQVYITDRVEAPGNNAAAILAPETNTPESPNYEIFKRIESGGGIDRDYIFDTFKGLGETVEHHGFNLNEKRNLTLQQYFTPYPVIEFITKALRLDDTKNLIVLDNSCGMGRMFRYLHPSTRILGIEKEEEAFRVCKALYPEAQIIHDDLINHILPTNSVDVSMINPPFTMHLEKRDSGLQNAQWGAMGPRSSIESHIAELEIAIRASDSYVAVILPTTFFSNENTRVFENWIHEHAVEVLRVDLPKDAHAGANWPTTLIIYDTSNGNRYEIRETEFYHWTVNRLSDLNDLLLAKWKDTEYYHKYVRRFMYDAEEYQKRDVILKTSAQVTIPKVTIPKIPITGDGKVNICVNPVNSGISIKTYDLLTSLKVKEYQDCLGKKYNNATKAYVDEWNIKAQRPEALYNAETVEEIRNGVKSISDVINVDEQISNTRKKLTRWLKLQKTPFEQYVQKENGEWEVKFEVGGICAMYPELYQRQRKRLNEICFENPKLELWDWQKHDVTRLSMKQHALLAADMGLGKTRMIIALGLLHGSKHNLIITESKLIGQFAGEIKNFGYQVNIIEKYEDTKRLKEFNLIAYSKIWRKATRGKTFAKALKKRCAFVALDEAHNIKANDSKRALACRSMHPKHWCLSSGTPIANYPRNIFSLLVCAFGDATELFKYGYWNPFIESFGATSGTRAFRERFVTVGAYISNQFDQTLDKGKRIREFPIVKDIDGWHDMLAPMLIRRCRSEPEVMRDVKIPKPDIKEVWITPTEEHVTYYKLWLDEFAEWFMSELNAEQAGDHKMDMIQLLVQIGKLAFVSTIPQSEKVKSDKAIRYNWNGNLTQKQEKIIELVTQHINQHQKVIVYSERPELQKLLAEQFKKRGIKGLVFTGKQPIPVREEILREFRVNGTPLLLATTTVGGTGLNLPEASVVIFADQSWTPAIHEQAIARVCRPQQKVKPLVYKLFNSGMIDEYYKQMMDTKQEGIDEGIDWQPHTFDPSNWVSFKDMSYRYLQAEGYI